MISSKELENLQKLCTIQLRKRGWMGTLMAHQSESGDLTFESDKLNKPRQITIPYTRLILTPAPYDESLWEYKPNGGWLTEYGPIVSSLNVNIICALLIL